MILKEADFIICVARHSVIAKFYLCTTFHKQDVNSKEP